VVALTGVADGPDAAALFDVVLPPPEPARAPRTSCRVVMVIASK
jgi:hypothetical protein